MTKTEKNQTVAGIVSLVVYVLVAWLSAKVFGVKLWLAFGVLVALRAFFGVVEGAAGILYWRLFGKREAVKGFLEVLRTNNFPKRFYEHDDFGNYLARIDERFPEPLRRAAKEMERVLGLFEQQGILVSLRMDSAVEAALEIYSPKASAPVFGADRPSA